MRYSWVLIFVTIFIASCVSEKETKRSNSISSIEITSQPKTLDKNTQAVYAALEAEMLSINQLELLSKARERNPNINGRVEYKITVGKSGVLSSIEIIKSNINDREFEEETMNEIKKIHFGSEIDEDTTIIVPVTISK